MADIWLFNTLTRKKDKFEPINPPEVGMYACGPTVYLFAHIGHMRRYVGDDILKRVLTLSGYKVKHVMNITDVGHLTSDADSGEDKIEKSARETGKSAWDIAKFYESQFFASTDALNIIRPDIICRATEHIKEQIDMIQKIEKKGFSYKTDDGIYFDTSRLPNYGRLTGGREGIKAGARIELSGKKNPTDFALWKFSPKDSKRQMEWPSPWGIGFPGWHIECSAMSTKYLGETFDIHTGGIDHIAIHHTNEIAQSEGASGKEPVHYWIHHEFLRVDGSKMAKSLKNTYTVDDVTQKGFDPVALRYLFLTAHYRDSLNFTWEALEAASVALRKLREFAVSLRSEQRRTALSPEKEGKLEEYQEQFASFVNDDLNTPRALAVVWEILKSNIPSQDKYDALISADEVLGLGLRDVQAPEVKVPDEVTKLVAQRQALRSEGKFDEGDKIRLKVEKLGYGITDSDKGPIVKPVQNGK